MNNYINIKKHVIKNINTNNNNICNELTMENSKIFQIVLTIEEKYIPITLYIKYLTSKIYIYSIIDNIKNLLYITDICNVHDIEYLSVPENNGLMLFNLNKLFDKKIEYIRIKLDYQKTISSLQEQILKVNVMCYSNKIIQVFRDICNNVYKIEMIKRDIKKTICFKNQNVKYIIFSNSGDFYMTISDSTSITITNINEKINNSFILKHIVNNDYSNKWLISDDGNILVNKIDNKIKIIMLDKLKTLVYTQTIKLNKNDSVSMKHIYFNNTNVNNLIIWNENNNYIKITSIVKYENEFKIFQMLNLKCTLCSKTTNILNTNNIIYLYKNEENLIVYDIGNLLLIPAIVEHIKI